jgi:general secretion pathway protein K
VRTLRRSQGFAAILAIGIAGAIASTASYLSWDTTLAWRQLENMRSASQADLAVRAALKWAAATIAQDDGRIDHRGEAWARAAAHVAIEGVQLEGVIVDEQAKFNINNLSDASGRTDAEVAAFRRILARAKLPESLADAVTDWLDADDVQSGPGGAEDAYYLGLERPYRTAGRAIADLQELVLVKGFTADAVRRLGEYVTALPGDTRVNVNTASADLLAALLPGIPEADLRALVARRDQQPFRTAEELTQKMPASAVQAAGELVDVRSEYFTTRGTVRVGRVDRGYSAVITRKALAVIRVTQGAGA